MKNRKNVVMTPFEKIKKYCKEHGTSIQELAEKSGISAGTIYNWKYKTPSTTSLEKMASIMNVSISSLFTDTDADENSNNEVDLNNNTNLYFYNGKPIPKEDMDYVRGLLKHLGEARDN